MLIILLFFAGFYVIASLIVCAVMVLLELFYFSIRGRNEDSYYSLWRTPQLRKRAKFVLISTIIPLIIAYVIFVLSDHNHFGRPFLDVIFLGSLGGSIILGGASLFIISRD